MSDNQELEAFLRTEKVELPPWESREWLHYSDVNQGSYQNQINFDGQTASHHWQCLSDAYVVIPISVSSSTGTAYTSTTVLAPKDGGIDNLITGLSVGDVQSVWLNETSGQTPLINSLRKTLEKDQEWLDNESSESMFTQTTSDYVAQDCINALATPNLTYGLNSQPFIGASGANVTVGTFASQSIRNPLYNKAFEDAAKSFVLQCPFDSTTASFRGNVIVKLKNLHPIFECMVFPIKGLHLKLTLFCNYASFQPFVCSNGAAPAIKIGTNSTGLTSCMLYYPSIKPSDALEAKLNSKLKEGVTRSINFMMTDFFGPSMFNNTSPSISQVISPSIAAPQRVWVFTPPTNSLTSSTAWSPLMSAARFSNVNMAVVGRPYLSFALEHAYDFWQSIKDTLPLNGVTDSLAGLIDYRGWLANKRFVMIDTSRFQGDRNLETPTTLQLTAQRKDLTSNSGGNAPGPVDYIILTQRLWSLKFEMVNGSFKLQSSGVLV